MSLTWTCPWWLLGLLVLAGFAALLLARRHSTHWRTVCVYLPTLAGACFLLALAGPQWQHAPAARHIVVLLDLSPSTRSSPWQSPGWVRGFLSNHLGTQTRVSIVGFADAPQVLLADAGLQNPQDWPAQWPRVAGTTSNLAAALRWRAGEDDRRPRWVITDGLLDVSPLAAEERALALTVAAPAAPDAGVTGLQALPDGRGVRLQAQVTVTGPLHITAEFLRGGTLLARRDVILEAAGTQVLSVRDEQMPSAPLLYEVRLAAPRGRLDDWPENDRATILAPAAGPPRVMMVTNRPVLPPLPSDTLQVVSPRDLPRSLGELASVQGLVLLDIAAADLGPDAPALLDRYVRQTGGGLLLVGGQHAFGPGGYAGTVLETLAPLSSTPPERPPLRVVFLLDASGSMGEAAPGGAGQRKFKFVIEGVNAASGLLKDTDLITAIAFGERTRVLASGEKKAVQTKLSAALRDIVPSGPTDPDQALPLFTDELDAHTMVILLTDGEIPRMDIPRWSDALARSKARLTLVAPPTGPGTLESLAEKTKAAWLPTNDPTEWPALLRRAVELPILGKARENPVRWQGVRQESLAGTTSRWVETWLKREATAWAGPVEMPPAAGAPRAAVVRRGLGQVGALSFAAEGAAYQQLMTLMQQEILAPAGDRRYSASAQRRDGRWVVRVAGHDEQGFFNGQRLVLDALAAGGASTTLPLEQIGPGEYEAVLPETIGTFRGIISRRDNGAGQLVARLNPPALPAAEWPANAVPREVPPEARVQRIGVAETLITQWRPRLAGTRRNLAPGAALLGAALLLAALWLRRGRVG